MLKKIPKTQINTKSNAIDHKQLLVIFCFNLRGFTQKQPVVVWLIHTKVIKIFAFGF
jgi:hypothetical protein